jgi:hypothetical protein
MRTLRIPAHCERLQGLGDGLYRGFVFRAVSTKTTMASWLTGLAMVSRFNHRNTHAADKFMAELGGMARQSPGTWYNSTPDSRSRSAETKGHPRSSQLSTAGQIVGPVAEVRVAWLRSSVAASRGVPGEQRPSDDLEDLERCLTALGAGSSQSHDDDTADHDHAESSDRTREDRDSRMSGVLRDSCRYRAG